MNKNKQERHCDLCENSSERKTERDDKEKRYIAGRLNRIVGQLGGVKRMIEEDRYCEEVLVQLSAIDSAVKSISAYILEQHMRGCILSDVKAGKEESVDEFVALLKRFML